MTMSDPSINGDNGRGRNVRGQFGPGNTFGKGNPFNKQACELRVALIKAVKPSDIRAIVKKLIEQAREGDIHSAREVLNRTLGRPPAMTLGGDVVSDPEKYLSDEERARLDKLAAAIDGGFTGDLGYIKRK